VTEGMLMSCSCSSNNSGELGLFMKGMLKPLIKGSLKGSSNALINDAWRQSNVTDEVFIADDSSNEGS
jgi:hypothetical protein